jgi:DNA replication protein DnaC
MIRPKTMTAGPSDDDKNEQRAHSLGLFGLLAHWDEVGEEPWIDRVLDLEENERRQRSLERRIQNARIGRFKPLADFDWSWPKKIDRQLVEDVFRFDFLRDAANVVFIGPNGVGKTTLAQNLAYQAVLHGHTARFTSASHMLAELSEADSPSALHKRLSRYVRPALLVVDEVGYLSYDSRHADLLFEIVNRRQDKSTAVTTNRPFSEWNEVFPNSSSVVALIDRLVHRAELVEIDAESYRLKEAKERTLKRRGNKPPKGKKA